MWYESSSPAQADLELGRGLPSGREDGEERRDRQAQGPSSWHDRLLSAGRATPFRAG